MYVFFTVPRSSHSQAIDEKDKEQFEDLHKSIIVSLTTIATKPYTDNCSGLR